MFQFIDITYSFSAEVGMDDTDNPITRIMLFIDLKFIDEIIQVPNLCVKIKVSEVKLIIEAEYPRRFRNCSYYLKLKCNQIRLDDDHSLEYHGIRDRSTLEVEFVDAPTSSPPPSDHPPVTVRNEVGDADIWLQNRMYGTTVNREDYFIFIFHALRKKQFPKKNALALQKSTNVTNPSVLDGNLKISGFYYEPDHKVYKTFTYSEPNCNIALKDNGEFEQILPYVGELIEDSFTFKYKDIGISDDVEKKILDFLVRILYLEDKESVELLEENILRASLQELSNNTLSRIIVDKHVYERDKLIDQNSIDSPIFPEKLAE